jgi:hypothetical protein
MDSPRPAGGAGRPTSFTAVVAEHVGVELLVGADALAAGGTAVQVGGADAQTRSESARALSSGRSRARGPVFRRTAHEAEEDVGR